ncbi:hypothetical protein YC2023_023527 [Brassica napus]
MAPKKNDDKVAELIQRDDERFVAVEGKLSTMEERMNEMMRMMASGFERLELRKVDQSEGRDQREAGLISSDLISNPVDSAKPALYKGEGSRKEVLEEPLSVNRGRSASVMGPGVGSVTRQRSPLLAYDGREESLTRRIEIPLFTGEEAESWVLRVEQYFEIGEFTDEEKLRAVRICFTGDALPWYRWERTRNPFLSCEQMKVRVLEQFTTTTNTSAGERVLRLQQTGTVRSFRREFIALASNAPEISDPILELVFVSGLRPQIKAGVKLMGAKGLQKVMDVALLVEEWSGGGDPAEEADETATKTSRASNGCFQAQNGKQAQQTGSGPNQNKTKPNQSNTTSLNATGTKPNHNRLKPPFRRLTSAEVAKWKAEGICFRCDEKYVYPHKCAQAEVVVLMVMDDGTELDVSNCSMELEGTYQTTQEEVEVAEVSISSIEGEAMLIEYNGVAVEEGKSVELEAVPVGLRSILEEYEGVFAEPTELPPSRGKEHAILLQKDASPLEEIGSEVERDEELSQLLQELRRDPSTHPDYSIVQGRLLRQGKLVVPKTSSLVGVILREYHDSKYEGHGGYLRRKK